MKLLKSYLVLACFALAACSDAPAPPAVENEKIGDSLGVVSSQEARKLFGAKPTGSAQSPAPVGGYANGCLAGGQELAETGPTWQAMRLSRNRNWAHPTTLDYVTKLSAFAATQPGWDGLYIGDMSQPRGGPMLSGHRSHQSGLDIDIWLRPADDLTLTRQQRENISSISLRRANGAFTNDNWSQEHFNIIREAAQDPRVTRIFIFPGAKVKMCEMETGDRRWLNKIRPWWGHHYHIHVRLSCPPGATGCVNQAPPPKGDGCADAQTWVDNILNPPRPDPDAPPPKPRRQLLMADLPAQCASVLQSD